MCLVPIGGRIGGHASADKTETLGILSVIIQVIDDTIHSAFRLVDGGVLLLSSAVELEE